MKKNLFLLRNILKVRSEKYKKSRVLERLQGSPQLKGIVKKLAIVTPKKPNSAIRHIAKVGLYKHGRQVFARIPGIGLLPTRYNRVLVRGGRANDLPTVRLTLIRGVFDFSGLPDKKKRRSLYGTIRPESVSSHIRRRYRHLAS